MWKGVVVIMRGIIIGVYGLVCMLSAYELSLAGLAIACMIESLTG